MKVIYYCLKQIKNLIFNFLFLSFFISVTDRVTMYVFEEMINGKKLTEIINETHENVKYLPGHKLPENIVSALLLRKLVYIFPTIFSLTLFHS
jgi:glycerol-3-phosphate dehydrogenase